MSYSITPVTADRWARLEEFFGRSGAYAHCWCTWFRQRQKDFDAGARDGGAGNHALLRRLTTDGQVPGLIAEDGSGEPVGRVSVGPREHFPRILRSTALRPEPSQDAENLWAVVCFWVPRRYRGEGVAGALLAGAVRYAAQRRRCRRGLPGGHHTAQSRRERVVHRHPGPVHRGRIHRRAYSLARHAGGAAGHRARAAPMSVSGTRLA